jgi:hypothetical protein
VTGAVTSQNINRSVWVTLYVPTSLTLQDTDLFFNPQCIYRYRISQTVDTDHFSNRMNRSVFLMETRCVFCMVGTELENVIYTDINLLRPCHGSGSLLSAFYRTDPGSVSGQSIWDCCWKGGTGPGCATAATSVFSCQDFATSPLYS